MSYGGWPMKKGDDWNPGVIMQDRDYGEGICKNPDCAREGRKYKRVNPNQEVCDLMACRRYRQREGSKRRNKRNRDAKQQQSK